jgi:hypothetical protein
MLCFHTVKKFGRLHICNETNNFVHSVYSFRLISLEHMTGMIFHTPLYFLRYDIIYEKS